MGVQLDQHLVWNEHVSFLCKVAALKFLKYAKKLLLQETLSHIYRDIFESYFRYCSSVWDSCGESRLLTLQKLQNRAARIVTSSSYYQGRGGGIDKNFLATRTSLKICYDPLPRPIFSSILRKSRALSWQKWRGAIVPQIPRDPPLAVMHLPMS